MRIPNLPFTPELWDMWLNDPSGFRERSLFNIPSQTPLVIMGWIDFCTRQAFLVGSLPFTRKQLVHLTAFAHNRLEEIQ